MRVSEILRYYFFWSLDFLKGSPIKKFYNEIKSVNKYSNSRQSLNSQAKAVSNILTHSITTTPYYKKCLGYKKIEDFPVVNKNIINTNKKAFLSNAFVPKTLFKVSTSGSTGVPFEVFQDKLKKIRNTADNIYFSEQAGFKPGYLLTYLRMWKAFEKKSYLVKLIQNLNPIDVFDLQNFAVKTSLIDNLAISKSSNSWLGYASAFEAICKFLDKNDAYAEKTKKLKSAIAISESLTAYTKQKMKTYFDVDVVSRYSNVENGIIAQQPANQDYFEINQASYYVELLALESNKPAENGKLGRIVITDLYNYAMPMIRYDTGDVGVLQSVEGKNVLKEIHGRKIDVIYNTKGEALDINIMLLINKYPELKQGQLIQKSVKTYHLKVNCDTSFEKLDQLKNILKIYLGDDAIISSEYVNEIPLLASGKRRVMINEMC
ncbi:coenzyme F390 synthetase [Aquimarina agarivorans]|uniref:coenzyme F390 synthetase n=1 Tax=Aquimarina agarivorans TaxID=980584 RepID=UPI000248E7DF|nr:coenzyme F390 synthetase [Aquimarina agarivorans]